RYTDNEEVVFLGHSVTQRKNVSDATAKLIDDEIRRLIDNGEMMAEKILTEHRDELEKLAVALLEYETLSGEEVKALLRGEPIVRPTADDEPTPTPRDNSGRKSSVPSAGKANKGPQGGLEAEPQPGS
ncbi:MAG: cell division protein FtsH, partial [Rhodospirillales bacterium]|nr:cell division protein FtsH [Rhodospirillales bacterium]